MRKYNNKLIAITISSLALATPLVFGHTEADAAQTNSNSGQHKTVQSNVNQGNGFLNSGKQDNKNDGREANQENNNQGNGVANGGTQSNQNKNGKATQKNDNQGNGVWNSDKQENKNNGENANQENSNQGNGVANGVNAEKLIKKIMKMQIKAIVTLSYTHLTLPTKA